MIGLIYFIVFVIGTVQVFQEYRFILEYKRDERIFVDYENEKNKDDLLDIVSDADQCGF